MLGTPDSIEEFEKLEAELSDKNGRLWFPFFKGTFEDVKREFASRSDPDTILVIYLHSNSEKGDEIGKQILASREASANYDEPTLICWMANAGANYQYERLARKLGYSGAYPAFLFFSDFKGKLKLEKAISGTEISLSSLNNELNEVKSLLTIRSLSEETNAKSESQILRADQDAAYQMSLAADRQKREEALRKQKEEEMEIERKMALEAELKAEEQERAKRLEKLKENLVPESQEGIIISTQLLDGRRVNHRFALASNIQVR